MKHFFLAVFTFLSLSLHAQWRAVAPVGTTINDIVFTDRYTGYAVYQSSGIGNCTVSHGLMKTIDEGDNWVRLNTGNTSAINAVFFINALTGWYAANSSEIRKTTDGGVTWTQQTFGVGSGYNDIWFLNANTGYVTGNSGLLRRTTNGGGTWTTIASGVTVNLRKIHFPTPTVGYIACSNGQVLKTTNGGTSWTPLTTGMGGLNDIFFTDASTGYACTSNNLYKTTNGGTTWTLLTTGAINPVLRIFFSTPDIGYVTVDGQGIMRTSDAGQTWTLAPTQNGLYDTFYSVHFVDQHTGYVSGTLGRINKTTDGGVTWNNVTSGLGTELFTVAVPHQDTAFAGGKEGKIFKTHNGGTHYYQQAKLVDGLSIVQKLYFQNTMTGFAALDSGRIFKTINGGKDWELKPTGTLQAITDIHFINNQDGFASVGGEGLVLKTNDQGENWQSISTNFPNNGYKGVWFANADTGFVITSSVIVRTLDGGLTWDSVDPTNASSLNDIVFVNDTTGYCAGSFGKILATHDAGNYWYEANTTPTNAAINEMWFADAATGYFARQTSQSFTIDSCQTIGSASTACLANNWTMNAIAMTNGGTHGYCVGGLNGVIHQTETPEIIRAYVSKNAYCAGSSIFVGYHAKGFFGGTNVFTAQLSNASGSFASPVNIGTFSSGPLNYQSGIITATLPAGASGAGYRIRVVASNPAILSPDNGIDLFISNSVTPTVSLTANIPGETCPGTLFTFNVSDFGGGLDPDFAWTLNGQSIANIGNQWQADTLQNGDEVGVSMVSSLTCASALPVFSMTYTAQVIDSLPLDLGPDLQICPGDSLQLTAPEGFNYLWSPAAGLSAADMGQPMAGPTETTEYTLTITDSAGCIGADSIVMQVLTTGCTNPYACNYDPEAGCDDGGCDFSCLDPCPWDLDDNGVIGFQDMAIFLTYYGCSGMCTADFDFNGNVGFSDLNSFLSNFGVPCPE